MYARRRSLAAHRTPLPAAPVVIAGVAVALLALTGCASSDKAPVADSTKALKVVTSTNVWASVVSAVGGDKVNVSAVLSDPSADPHSFEATPAVVLDLSKADLILVNGGGYDDWALTTIASLPAAPPVLNAVDLSGLDTGEGFNEHVFYDLDSVELIANKVAAELSALAPADGPTFTANATAFTAGLTALKTRAAAVGADHPGTKAIATEPVAGYLLADIGLQDVTPAGFSQAVEADAEVSVKDLADTKNLLSTKSAALLFNNIQTSGPVTDELVAAAKAAGAGVIGVTETLPAGITGYTVWIAGTVDAVSAALNA
ncbi:metal ABC transporter solute-binding protein, Zn/Mn family [Nakamurella antarctica]|nr:zinc ABC transporter substrate-binding protein [Nakamurella antarctica]